MPTAEEDVAEQRFLRSSSIFFHFLLLPLTYYCVFYTLWQISLVSIGTFTCVVILGANHVLAPIISGSKSRILQQ